MIDFLCWNFYPHEIGFPLSYKYENSMDTFLFAMSFDLASQNNAVKGLGEVYIGKTIIIGRFWVDNGILWRSFGDD